ncbi:MAG: MFS transporter [Candidatus Sumerlaeia bacterium]|nr:MFS transporter [Candidatus Sumerlaeia bacterium]
MATPWKKKLSWALYDFGNSAYATTVMAALFPQLYGKFWGEGIPGERTTLELVWAGGLASFGIALLGPLLGGIADRTGRKKLFLGAFAAIAIACTVMLAFAPQAPRWYALGAFLLSLFCFTGANVFYDSLLVDVAEESELDTVSSLGFALGYCGGGLLFLGNLLIITNPGWVGLDSALEASRWSILSVALWWTVFALPLFFVVKERAPEHRLSMGQAARGGFQAVMKTLGKIRQSPLILTFLLTYFFYIDGVNSVMRIAVKFGSDLGFGSGVLMGALLLVQLVGFLSTLGFGYAAARIGAVRILQACVVGYMGLCFFTLWISTPAGIFVFAGGIGLFQGALQSLSRSVFAGLVPAAEAGEFFGVYNLLGKFSSFMGPILITGCTVALQQAGVDSAVIQRVVLLALLPLFLVGGLGLWRFERLRRG